MKNDNRKFHISAVFFILLFTLLVFCATLWLWEAGNWSNLKANEIVLQLSMSNKGVSSKIIGGFYLKCLLPTICALFAAVFFVFSIRKKTWREKLLGFTSCALAAVIVCMFAAAVKIFEVDEYLAYEIFGKSSTYIEDHSAKNPEITFPEEKRNLVYIWLESMEASYADVAHGGAFSENVIPELTKLAEENISFTGKRGGVNGGYSVEGTTWTMGAMFAETSGLPLKIPFGENSMETLSSFFPGVQTLGDVLDENGYHQLLVLGSEAFFGGRKAYFTQHGDFDILDYYYAPRAGYVPEDYAVWWGYEDEYLFKIAKDHLVKLAAAGEPFNLSLLTVDTHFPSGYVCNLCQDEYDNQYSNVIRCSDRQVYDFVRWIQQQDFYENTTIVICGDHITMDAGYGNIIPSDYPRKTFVTVINPAAELAKPDEYREYSSLDIYPTVLAAMGAKIDGNRLGLGVNLFSGEKTLVEKEGLAELNRQLKKKSDYLNGLSGIDDDIYELSARFEKLDTNLQAEVSGSAIRFTISNLYEEKDNFRSMRLYAKQIVSGAEVNICNAAGVPDEENKLYTADLPLDKLPEGEYFIDMFVFLDNSCSYGLDLRYKYNAKDNTLSRY